LFYRPFNLTDPELSSDNIKNNGLSEEPLLDTQDSILFEPKNYSFQIKPLGDINIKLEDIIPCLCKYLTLYIFKSINSLTINVIKLFQNLNLRVFYNFVLLFI